MRDPASIVSILVAMGIITEGQLSKAFKERIQFYEDKLAAELLITDGLLTSDQLEIALSAQMGMRNGKTDRALAVADMALHRKRRHAGCSAVVDICAKVTKKVKTGNRQGISPAVLAKPLGG